MTALIGSCAIFSLACDGAIKVRGKVYAQRASKGNSQAFVDELSPDSSQLTPLRNAQVTLYHGGDYSRQPINKSTLWQETCQTDGNGSFELGGTTSPFKSHAALVVEKEGYVPVTKIFLHEKLAPHQAIIILEAVEEIPK